MKLRLCFMSGPRDGESLGIVLSDNGRVEIGRSLSCTVVLTDDPDVSRRHAALVSTGPHWILEDLGSANGTFVGEFTDERRIEVPMMIEPGKIFRIGLTRLMVEEESNSYIMANASAHAAAKSASTSAPESK